MDIEQLKLILETVESLGGDTKEFAIWYLASRLVPNVLLFLFGLAVILMLKRVIFKMCNMEEGRGSLDCRTIAIALGVEFHPPWDSIEMKKVMDKIKELLANAKDS